MIRLFPMLPVFLAACASAPAPFESHRMATIADGARVLVPVSFSHDGRSAAYVEQRGDGCRMVWGSHTGKPYGILC